MLPAGVSAILGYGGGNETTIPVQRKKRKLLATELVVPAGSLWLREHRPALSGHAQRILALGGQLC